jgi:intraflagellar transport protein 80
MAINGRQLDAAETALAAINEVAKLHFILYIKDKIPSEEGRNAELAVYQRRFDEAEQILLQASPPLIYRAIKLNIRLYRWTRALQIAVDNKTHVDTVLAYREVSCYF